MKSAGAQAKRSFEEGFSSTGGGADQMAQSFAQKFASSFSTHLKGADIAPGVNSLVDRMGQQVDAKLAAQLKTKLPVYCGIIKRRNKI
jgi:hypothetical protein